MITEKRNVTGLLLSITLLAWPFVASASTTKVAPSFDCRHAAQDDELAVCANPNLSELDQLLAVGFHYLKKHNGKSAAQTLARKFLSRRKACGSEIDCIQSAYVDAMVEYQHAGAPIMVPGWAVKILPEALQPVAPVARTSKDLQPAPATQIPADQASIKPDTAVQPVQRPAANPNAKVLRMPNGGAVWVWRDADAQDEGITLIQSGADSELIAPLLACIVPSGVHAAVTDFGILTSDVIVIDGSKAGCRGNVSTDYLHLS